MPKRDMKMLIVGAGQGGVALIGLFLRSGRVDSIVGVVDRDMNAPGIALAQELGIAVSTNFRDFLGIEGLYEIINVTGREDVQLELLESQPAGVEVVGGHSAKMLWDLIDEHEKIENELQESRKTLQRAYDGMDQKVRERTFELKHEMDDRMDAERRVEHLNKVLRAIRSVSQLIIKENNRDHLVQEICNILVETRGYLIAWIALIDETAGEPYVVSAAVDRPVKSAVSLIKSGDYPPCYTETLSDSGLIYFQDVSVSCKKCVLSEEYCGGGRLCIRIEYGEQVYGILVVALPGEYAIDIEEQELFVEMAGDIAYALHGIEVERRRQAVEAELATLNEELEQKVEDRSKKVEDARAEAEKRVEELSRSQTAMLYMVEDLNRQSAELKNAQDRLVRSERLAALGELAGVVAHELRNPLAIIKSAAYFLNERMAGVSDEKILRHVQIIDAEIDVADKIIGDVLSFASVKEPNIMSVSIVDAIKRTLERIVVPNNIEVVIEVSMDAPTVMADEGQLIQLLSNLFTNAIQAMPEGGTLTINSMKEGEGVGINIVDSGQGVPEADIDKLFEPLFSTKTKGTGLGLALCKQVIDKHKGKLNIFNNDGAGVTCSIMLAAQ